MRIHSILSGAIRGRNHIAQAIALILAAVFFLSACAVQQMFTNSIQQKDIILLKNELAAAKEREKDHSGDILRISQLENELVVLEKGRTGTANLDKRRVAELEKQVLLLENEKQSTIVHGEVKIAAHLITPPSATFEAEQKTENCLRLSTQPMGHAKFRIVVYQKQGGQQLIDLIVHYLQALTYDEIVVVANEDGKILETTPVYKELISKGIHLWQCIGSRDEKGDLWTQVVTQYKDTSDFLQPTDVDEYLALLSPTNSTSLLWDRTSLHAALDELPLSNGRPYKTLDSKPTPHDCENGGDMVKKKPLDLLKYQPLHCKLSGFSKPKDNCYNKVFFRGSEFTETDLGNHFGSIKFLNACEKEGLEAGFQPTSFVLIHYQTLDFHDWLVHALRMATDAKFNRLDLDDKCPKGHDKPWHSCVIFRELVDLNFSLYGIRELYHNKGCNVESYLDAAGVTTLTC